MSLLSDYCTIFVKCIDGLEDLAFKMPFAASISDVKKEIINRLPESIVSRVSISTVGGIDISPYKSVKDLYESTTYDHNGDISSFINLKLNICLCGGKGGFGELLKSNGRKMSKKNKKNLKSNSKDLYNTLDGRKVKSIRKMKQIEEYMSTLDEKERVKIAEKTKRLQSIIDLDFDKNVKFEDNKFLDDLESQIDDIRDMMNIDESENESEEIEGTTAGNSSILDENNDDDSEDSDDSTEENAASSSITLLSNKAKLVTLFDNSDHGDNSTFTKTYSKRDGKKPIE